MNFLVMQIYIYNLNDNKEMIVVDRYIKLKYKSNQYFSMFDFKISGIKNELYY